MMQKDEIFNNNQMEEDMITIEDILEWEHETEFEMEQIVRSKKYAIINCVLKIAKRHNFEIPQNVLDEIGQMIIKAKGNVAVITRRVDNPIVVRSGEKVMEYWLDETSDDEKMSKPSVLSLRFITSEKIMKRLPEQIRFEKWLRLNGVPFARDIAGKTNLENDVTVRVYKYVRDFAIAVSVLPEIIDSDFVGQNVRNRAFSPKMSIAVVKNNQVHVYVPEWTCNKSVWMFYIPVNR